MLSTMLICHRETRNQEKIGVDVVISVSREQQSTLSILQRFSKQDAIFQLPLTLLLPHNKCLLLPVLAEFRAPRSRNSIRHPPRTQDDTSPLALLFSLPHSPITPHHPAEFALSPIASLSLSLSLSSRPDHSLSYALGRKGDSGERKE